MNQNEEDDDPWEREREIRMFYYKSVSVRLNERKIIRIGVHTDLVKDKSHGEEIA